MKGLSERERQTCEKAIAYLRARGYEVTHQMMTIQQLTKLLGVSNTHIFNLIQRGDFPKPYDVSCRPFEDYRGRKSLRFSSVEVGDWLEKRRNP